MCFSTSLTPEPPTASAALGILLLATREYLHWVLQVLLSTREYLRVHDWHHPRRTRCASVLAWQHTKFHQLDESKNQTPRPFQKRVGRTSFSPSFLQLSPTTIKLRGACSPFVMVANSKVPIRTVFEVRSYTSGEQ